MYTQNKNKKKVFIGGFMRLDEVLELIPISKSAWWLGIKNGKYPKSVRIGTRTTAWARSDIANLMQRLYSEA